MFHLPVKQNTQLSLLISDYNWQWANTINLPTQWKVPLRTLQQQRSRENLESKSFEKSQGSVFQEEEKRIKCTEPGRWPRMSITKRGSSWSLVETRPDVIGSQWRYLFVTGDSRKEKNCHPTHFSHRIYQLGQISEPCVDDEPCIGNNGEDHSDGNSAEPDGDLGSPD